MRAGGLRAESASLDAERETITRTTQQIHDLFEEMTGDRTIMYNGQGNDRDPILVNLGGSTPDSVRTQQLP